MRENLSNPPGLLRINTSRRSGSHEPRTCWLTRIYQLLDKDGIADDIHLFNDKLRQWEDYYNYHRPHGALDGQTPLRTALGKENLGQRVTEVLRPYIDGNQSLDTIRQFLATSPLAPRESQTWCKHPMTNRQDFRFAQPQAARTVEDRDVSMEACQVHIRTPHKCSQRARESSGSKCASVVPPRNRTSTDLLPRGHP